MPLWTTFTINLSVDRLIAKVVYRGRNLLYEQTRLTNKHVQVDLVLTEIFTYWVEVGIIKDRYIVH